MRKRLTYANVAATMALVLAMSGGALAANHYLINSTHQINPKVLRKLHGARGATGPNGVVGPQGVEGEQGPRGAKGSDGEPGLPAPLVLPAGKSESGDFAAAVPTASANPQLGAAVTFAVPLAAPILAIHVDYPGLGKTDANCSAPGSAARGYLCIYATTSKNLKWVGPSDPETSARGTGTGRFGFLGIWNVLAEGSESEVVGTYTVTAG